MTGPELPENPPERGDSVLVRYHSAGGADHSRVGDVSDVSGPPNAYTVRVDVGFAEDVIVDTGTYGVESTWPPDEDGTKRLGVLKTLRDAPGGERPAVDEWVDTFNSRSSLRCPECEGDFAVIRDEVPHCSDCGEAIDANRAERLAEQRRE